MMNDWKFCPACKRDWRRRQGTPIRHHSLDNKCYACAFKAHWVAAEEAEEELRGSIAVEETEYQPNLFALQEQINKLRSDIDYIISRIDLP